MVEMTVLQLGVLVGLSVLLGAALAIRVIAWVNRKPKTPRPLFMP